MEFFQNNLSEFFKNYWWIIIIIISCLTIITVTILLISKNKIKKELTNINKTNISKDEIFDAIGGRENLISHNLNGHRLSLTLKDYKLMNREKLGEFGVERVLSMSDKCILVGKDLSSIDELLNQI